MGCNKWSHGTQSETRKKVSKQMHTTRGQKKRGGMGALFTAPIYFGAQFSAQEGNAYPLSSK